MYRNLSLPSLTIAFSALLASAHGLWIEPSKDGISIHYGEYAHGEKEKAEKLAPYAKALRVRDAQGEAVEAVMREDGFHVATRGAATASVVEGPIYGEGAGATRYQAWLRYTPVWGRAEKPAADFPVDVVPVAGKKPAFLVYKDGQAAGGAWIEVTAPNGWSKWFEADSSGRVEIQAPWSGLYVIHAEHEDAKAGTQDGKAYAKSHQSVYLSIRKP